MILKHIFLSQLPKKFTTDDFADQIRRLIGDKTLDPEIYNITSSVDGVGTTHLSVLAEDGSAVSVTSTINHMSVSDSSCCSATDHSLKHGCQF